jgi:ligand-binding SRPBCC domain-containing protein
VAAPPERTFTFFSDASNLEAITPPFLNFSIITPLPITMREGTLIAYRLRLFGMPVTWVSRIEEWTPNQSFTDVQVRGPYAHWRHEHRFSPRDGGTLIADRVAYRVPLEPLSTPIHAFFVRPTIEKIFEHRRRVIERSLS